VRRRLKSDPSDPREPAHLRVYDPSDWPNPKCHPECAYWEARQEWHDEHPFDLDRPAHPEDLIAQGPDVPWHEEWV
jgi:hypothetical protein